MSQVSSKQNEKPDYSGNWFEDGFEWMKYNGNSAVTGASDAVIKYYEILATQKALENARKSGNLEIELQRQQAGKQAVAYSNGSSGLIENNADPLSFIERNKTPLAIGAFIVAAVVLSK